MSATHSLAASTSSTFSGASQAHSPSADKSVQAILHTPQRHWVGDGFPVYGLFDYRGQDVFTRSPFLLLDYAAPTQFAPHQGSRRGVGAHPHRGFETVTIVYAGEVEHRDSTGAGGIIGAGDVQWMTAGAGLVHDEFHSAHYSRTGGAFEMVQLWVNLPARHKMTAPRYQAITAQQIPEVPLPDAAGAVRIIAGQYTAPVSDTMQPTSPIHGRASTHTPINMWDVRLCDGATATLNQPEGWSTLLLVLAGSVRLHDGAVVQPAQVAVLSHSGSGVRIQAQGDAKVLLLAGEPIDEPVVGHGPFVMNTRAEIGQAIADLHSGRMGSISAV